ncbi:MAG: hypothetical protein C0483_15460 [Pirellula sp.]|nr:hypothetical protein [Pirellula sp.]
MNATPPASPAAARPPRRWFRRFVVFTIVGVALVFAAAPSLVSWSPALREALLRRMTGDIHAVVSVDSLRAGWLQPIVVTGLRLDPLAGGTGPATAGGETLLAVERIESDRPLWQMLWNRQDIGTLRIERPVTTLKFTDHGTNYAEVFAPLKKQGAKLPESLHYGARIRIVDGTLRGRSVSKNEPWEITGINLGLGVRAEGTTPSGKAEFIVEKGTLVARQPLAVGLCNDVLKYVAPVLADVAQTTGNISIELDDWRLPWNDFGNGDLSGRLTLHTVDVGPGPVVQSIIGNIKAIPLISDLYRRLALPEAVQLARESTVPFKMLPGGRIHHENLRFSVVDVVDVASHGTVGLDETLDLTTALGIHPPNAETRYLALLRVVTSQQWPVNIRGTLGKPIVDLSPLNNAWRELVFQKLPQDWQSGKASVGGDLLRGLSEQTGLPVGPETVGPLLQMLGPMIARQANPQPPQTQTPPSQAPGPMPRELALPDNGTNGSTTQSPPRPLPPTPTASPTGPTTAETIANGVGTALDVLEILRARRQATMDNRQVPPPVSPNGLPTIDPPPPAPRRPLLRGVLRTILEPPPPEPTATTAPSPRPVAPPPMPNPPSRDSRG